MPGWVGSFGKHAEAVMHVLQIEPRKGSFPAFGSCLFTAGNLAVLTPLEGESLQPSNLSAGATNELSVFFQAQKDGT